MTRALLLWVALAAVVAFSTAVEIAKFKTCEQSNFCSRIRVADGEKGQVKYTVDPSSVSVSGDKVTATLTDADDVAFNLELSGVSSGIARLRIVEATPLRTRYEPEGIVQPYDGKDLVEVSSNSTELVVKIAGTSNKIKLQYSPFEAEFLIGNTVVVSLNSQNLMNFEPTKEKPEAIEEPEKFENGTYKDSAAEAAWKANQEALAAFEPDYFNDYETQNPHGHTAVSMDATFPGAANVYGIPSHGDTLSLKYTNETDPYRLYNLDTYAFDVNSRMAVYGSIPLMIAHAVKRTVALFWLNSSETWIDIYNALTNGGKKGKFTHWISESGVMDMFILFGPKPQAIAEQFSTIVGTMIMPPRFSLGYHQSRYSYDNVSDCLQVDGNFDTYKIPYDVLWLDIGHTDGMRYFTWNPENYSDPLALQDVLSEKSRKLVTIVDPHIKVDPDYYVYETFSEADVFIKFANGSDYVKECWPGDSVWPDFTRDDVQALWAEQYSYENYKNATSIVHIWNDMNEPAVFGGPEGAMHKDAVHKNSFEHREVHNIYGQLMQRGTLQGLHARLGNERPFILSRAYFAGTQRYGAVWTGDALSDWDHFRGSTSMVLTANVVGLTFIGSDVGGFINDPDAELFLRWFQAGIFYPFFRGHANIGTIRREPWSYGEPTTSRVRAAILQRYAMLPYLYTVFHECNTTAQPILRPLWWHYPTDSKTFSLDDGFLVGSDLLTNPVYEQGATTKDLYLPGESWYNFIKTEKATAAGKHQLTVDLDSIIAYQRAGSVIPLQPTYRSTSALQINDPFTLRVALDANQTATGNLYLDDGVTYDFADGEYAYRTFTCEGGVLKSTNGDSKGTLVPENNVTEVIVLGVTTEPTTVVLNDGTADTTLEFEYDAATEALVIKEPNVLVASDWTITFQ